MNKKDTVQDAIGSSAAISAWIAPQAFINKIRPGREDLNVNIKKYISDLEKTPYGKESLVKTIKKKPLISRRVIEKFKSPFGLPRIATALAAGSTAALLYSALKNKTMEKSSGLNKSFIKIGKVLITQGK